MSKSSICKIISGGYRPINGSAQRGTIGTADDEARKELNPNTIRKMYINGATVEQLADYFKTTQQVIRNICGIEDR